MLVRRTYLSEFIYIDVSYTYVFIAIAETGIDVITYSLIMNSSYKLLLGINVVNARITLRSYSYFIGLYIASYIPAIAIVRALSIPAGYL